MLVMVGVGFFEWLGRSWLARGGAWLLEARVEKGAYDPLYGMLMHLAMSDGKYVSDEGEALHHIMVHFARVGTQEEELAVLQQLRSSNWKRCTFEEHCRNFARLLRWDRASRDLALEALVSITVADGVLDAKQRALLETARKIFGLPVGRVEALLARAASDNRVEEGSEEGPRRTEGTQSRTHHGSGEWRAAGERVDESHAWAYAELECSPDASVEQVKQQYRRLVKQFHPDALRSRGASGILIEQGHQRFLRIQRAYDALQENR